MDKMRILIVLRFFYCPSMSIGGAERQALKLATRLIERGVDVTVLDGQWEWGQPTRERIQGVPVRRHFTAWGMFNIRGIRRFSQYLYLLTLFLYLVRHRREYDLIHCQSALFEAAIAIWAGHMLGKRTLARSMASGAWGDVERLRQAKGDAMPGTRWMLRQFKKADRIVALNKQVADELIDIGVQPDRIVHIPNGVETKQIKPKTAYASEQPMAITFLGRLHPQKGLRALLLACKRMQESQPQIAWHLNLVGEGEMRGELQAMVRQFSMEEKVQFWGQVGDPFSILAQSDIFVLPSQSEGMSNALLEAMAHGLPCIVTDIPGNNDIIVDQQNGLLVQFDNDAGLAAAIVSLATDQGLRERLGRAALQMVNARFVLDSVADQYMALYTSLLHDAPHPQVQGD